MKQIYCSFPSHLGILVVPNTRNLEQEILHEVAADWIPFCQYERSSSSAQCQKCYNHFKLFCIGGYVLGRHNSSHSNFQRYCGSHVVQTHHKGLWFSSHLLIVAGFFAKSFSTASSFWSQNFHYGSLLMFLNSPVNYGVFWGVFGLWGFEISCTFNSLFQLLNLYHKGPLWYFRNSLNVFSADMHNVGVLSCFHCTIWLSSHNC